MKKKMINSTLMILCLIIEHLSLAQDGNYSLGRSEFKRYSKMNDAILFKSVIGQLSTHLTVGGISFELVATPADSNISKQAITLSYTSEKADGKRLQINLGAENDSVYYPDIPDWQLKPIANYVNSDYTAIFSYYGSRGSYNVRYHPAFADQLLGLRMFQADLIFRGRDMAYLPEDDTIGVLVSNSEKRFKLDTSLTSFTKLQNNLYHTYPNFDSYILTDWGKEIKFGVTDGNFYLSGEPYYLFTNNIADSIPFLYELKQILLAIKELPFKNDSSYISIKKLIQKETLTTNDLKRLEFHFDDLSKRYKSSFTGWLKSKYNEISDYGSYISEDLKKEIYCLEHIPADPDLISLSNLLSRGIYAWTATDAKVYLDRLQKKFAFKITNWITYDRLWDIIRGSRKVELLLKDSKNIDRFNKIIFDFNPVVFNSCIVTARFSALFRYIKEKDPANWTKFIEEINKDKKTGQDFPWQIKTPDRLN